jgi:hypothetical protein
VDTGRGKEKCNNLALPTRVSGQSGTGTWPKTYLDLIRDPVPGGQDGPHVRTVLGTCTTVSILNLDGAEQKVTVLPTPNPCALALLQAALQAAAQACCPQNHQESSLQAPESRHPCQCMQENAWLG